MLTAAWDEYKLLLTLFGLPASIPLTAGHPVGRVRGEQMVLLYFGRRGFIEQ